MKSFTIFSSLVLAFAGASAAAPPPPPPPPPASTPNLPYGKNAIPLFNLPTSFTPPVQSDPQAIENIRNTLALYAFAIDGKNFQALDRVFTADVYTNYSEPLNILTPLSTVQAVLGQSLSCVTTQHSYGTQLIEIKSKDTAFSVTYFRAAHFGRNVYKNDVATAYAQYQDSWKRQKNGQWKIVQRNFVYMGPLIGNQAVFTDCPV